MTAASRRSSITVLNVEGARRAGPWILGRLGHKDWRRVKYRDIQLILIALSAHRADSAMSISCERTHSHNIVEVYCMLCTQRKR